MSFANNDISEQDAFILQMKNAIEKVKRENPEYRVIPTNLPIAQAILESGWGTSRLARENNNFLGLKRKNKNAKFNSLEEGFAYYFDNLLNHYAYEDFREAIKRKEKPYILISYLDSYAENPRYEKKIKQIIQQYSLHW